MFSYSFAKINICLNIVEKRPDGYHNLQTVFYPIPLSDGIEIKPTKFDEKPYMLQVVGADIDGGAENNLIIKVLNSIKNDFNIPPLDIYLNKRIPIGAGLGGGSSNAACMMNLLNEMFSLNMTAKEMEERVAKFGADCAFFIQSKPVYATGIGDIMSPIEISLKDYYFVLVKPQVSVSTKEAYSGVVPQIPAISLHEANQQPIERCKNA